ncbi:MAG TPA: hypothetical protein VK858_12375 [Longimicrobiales bacterium]|nr:hypothetical protein [Longimicrobiales bacterium]
MSAPLRATCLGLAAVLAVSACSSSSPTDLDPAQEVLFHASYENYAWGYQNSGWYVDREGRVWSMAPAPMWQPEVGKLLAGERPGDTYPADELEAEYRAVRDSLLLQLPTEEVEGMSRLVREAAQGDFTPSQPTGNDAGIFLSGALLYEPADGTYRRVVLSIRGDWTVLNESSAAGRLADWLTDVASRIAAG